jgi:hypothetical protein
METSLFPVKDMLGAQGRWAGRDLYRATPAVTRDLGFPVLSEGPLHTVAFYDTQEGVDDLFPTRIITNQKEISLANSLLVYLVTSHPEPMFYMVTNVKG